MKRCPSTSAGVSIRVAKCSSMNLELAVLVLPVALRRNRFDRVPVLRYLAVFHAEQIVKRGWLAAELSLTHHQDKISFTEHFMDFAILHRDPLFRYGLQRLS